MLLALPSPCITAVKRREEQRREGEEQRRECEEQQQKRTIKGFEDWIADAAGSERGLNL